MSAPGSDVRAVPASGTAGAVTSLGSERGTRARIARLILENGPVTAALRNWKRACPVHAFHNISVA